MLSPWLYWSAFEPILRITSNEPYSPSEIIVAVEVSNSPLALKSTTADLLAAVIRAKS
jgi:hypothetical protein